MGNLRRAVLYGAMLALSTSCKLSAAELSIGVSVSDLGNPYFIQMARGAEAKARELGGDNVRVKVVSSAYDIDRQIAQVNDFVAQGVDIILLSAANYEGIEKAVSNAKAAGVKVIAVDVKAKGADATVTTDNMQAGRIACKDLAERIKGQGEVAIITGPPVSSILDRVSGCKQTLARYPKIKLVSSERNGGASQEGGLEVMTYLLTAYPNLQGVFAINDPSAMGAVNAAQQAKYNNLVVVAVDGAPIAEHALRQPDSLLKSTAAQFPHQQAAKAIEVGYQLMHGKSPPHYVYLVPTQLITKENLQH
ncbi:MAG: ABC transporter substrate-binding protein, partial [Pontibacterium sp.]